jgi:hypothetical protein
MHGSSVKVPIACSTAHKRCPGIHSYTHPFGAQHALRDSVLEEQGARQATDSESP